MPANEPHSPLFVTTRWSIVLAAKHEDSQQAMETLCRAYWYPLYAYVRRDGHAPHDAQDPNNLKIPTSADSERSLVRRLRRA